eukprot:1142329-Pelagomonas_calceolata.AAC.3
MQGTMHLTWHLVYLRSHPVAAPSNRLVYLRSHPVAAPPPVRPNRLLVESTIESTLPLTGPAVGPKSFECGCGTVRRDGGTVGKLIISASWRYEWFSDALTNGAAWVERAWTFILRQWPRPPRGFAAYLDGPN